jgi:hypothetical protein
MSPGDWEDCDVHIAFGVDIQTQTVCSASVDGDSVLVRHPRPLLPPPFTPTPLVKVMGGQCAHVPIPFAFPTTHPPTPSTAACVAEERHLIPLLPSLVCVPPPPRSCCAHACEQETQFCLPIAIVIASTDDGSSGSDSSSGGSPAGRRRAQAQAGSDAAGSAASVGPRVGVVLRVPPSVADLAAKDPASQFVVKRAGGGDASCGVDAYDAGSGLLTSAACGFGSYSVRVVRPLPGAGGMEASGLPLGPAGVAGVAVGGVVVATVLLVAVVIVRQRSLAKRKEQAAAAGGGSSAKSGGAGGKGRGGKGRGGRNRIVPASPASRGGKPTSKVREWYAAPFAVCMPTRVFRAAVRLLSVGACFRPARL